MRVINVTRGECVVQLASYGHTCAWRNMNILMHPCKMASVLLMGLFGSLFSSRMMQSLRLWLPLLFWFFQCLVTLVSVDVLECLKIKWVCLSLLICCEFLQKIKRWNGLKCEARTCSVFNVALNVVHPWMLLRVLMIGMMMQLHSCSRCGDVVLLALLMECWYFLFDNCWICC